MFINTHRQEMMIELSASDYEVMPVEKTVNGRFYQSYCADWLTWLVSNNPEATNFGPIYFLHCVSYQSQQDTGNYANQPVVRVGTQALNIRPGEFIFFPVISAFAESVDTGVQDDPVSLLNYVRTDLEGGDSLSDPSQATIVDVTDPDRIGSSNNIVPDLASHLVITDVFPLYVPPIQPGARLLRTSFDIPIVTEGVRDARIGGFFLLIKFNTQNKKYYIHTFGRGRGPYLASMFYEINVGPVLQDNTLTNHHEDWSASMIKSILKAKQDIGELDNKRFKHLQSILK